MTEVVLDASVVVKWFHTEGEDNVPAARTLRTDFEAGKLSVICPRLLHLEIVNVAGRRWRWQRTALAELARALDALSFELREPELGSIAEWTARGLTAYDASYVALAESEEIQLITDDQVILAVAPGAALALAAIEEGK
ncbi:MAG: type II toxin-antitoxin system VapC family toxin [Candidatus Eremiobacteraeota bacterium]|nr:type II toxin-antitoxin system VapC family toxin [Candidatus Eremiobacteraeota bacterium]